MGLISGPRCLRLELSRSVQRFKLYGELLLIFDSLSPWIQVWGELLMNSSFVAVNSADTGPAGTARQTAPGYREPFVARTCAAHVITERYVNYHSPVLQEGTGLDHFPLSLLCPLCSGSPRPGPQSQLCSSERILTVRGSGLE